MKKITIVFDGEGHKMCSIALEESWKKGCFTAPCHIRECYPRIPAACPKLPRWNTPEFEEKARQEAEMFKQEYFIKYGHDWTDKEKKKCPKTLLDFCEKEAKP